MLSSQVFISLSIFVIISLVFLEVQLAELKCDEDVLTKPKLDRPNPENATLGALKCVRKLLEKSNTSNTDEVKQTTINITQQKSKGSTNSISNSEESKYAASSHETSNPELPLESARNSKENISEIRNSAEIIPKNFKSENVEVGVESSKGTMIRASENGASKFKDNNIRTAELMSGGKIKDTTKSDENLFRKTKSNLPKDEVEEVAQKKLKFGSIQSAESRNNSVEKSKEIGFEKPIFNRTTTSEKQTDGGKLRLRRSKDMNYQTPKAEIAMHPSPMYELNWFEGPESKNAMIETANSARSFLAHADSTERNHVDRSRLSQEWSKNFKPPIVGENVQNYRLATASIKPKVSFDTLPKFGKQRLYVLNPKTEEMVLQALRPSGQKNLESILREFKFKEASDEPVKSNTGARIGRRTYVRGLFGNPEQLMSKDSSAAMVSGTISETPKTEDTIFSPISKDVKAAISEALKSEDPMFSPMSQDVKAAVINGKISEAPKSKDPMSPMSKVVKAAMVNGAILPTTKSENMFSLPNQQRRKPELANYKEKYIDPLKSTVMDIRASNPETENIMLHLTPESERTILKALEFKPENSHEDKFVGLKSETEKNAEPKNLESVIPAFSVSPNSNDYSMVRASNFQDRNHTEPTYIKSLVETLESKLSPVAQTPVATFLIASNSQEKIPTEPNYIDKLVAAVKAKVSSVVVKPEITVEGISKSQTRNSTEPNYIKRMVEGAKSNIKNSEEQNYIERMVEGLKSIIRNSTEPNYIKRMVERVTSKFRNSSEPNYVRRMVAGVKLKSRNYSEPNYVKRIVAGVKLSSLNSSEPDYLRRMVAGVKLKIRNYTEPNHVKRMADELKSKTKSITPNFGAASFGASTFEERNLPESNNIHSMNDSLKSNLSSDPTNSESVTPQALKSEDSMIAAAKSPESSVPKNTTEPINSEFSIPGKSDSEISGTSKSESEISGTSIENMNQEIKSEIPSRREKQPETDNIPGSAEAPKLNDSTFIMPKSKAVMPQISNSEESMLQTGMLNPTKLAENNNDSAKHNAFATSENDLNRSKGAAKDINSFSVDKKLEESNNEDEKLRKRYRSNVSASNKNKCELSKDELSKITECVKLLPAKKLKKFKTCVEKKMKSSGSLLKSIEFLCSHSHMDWKTCPVVQSVLFGNSKENGLIYTLIRKCIGHAASEKKT